MWFNVFCVLALVYLALRIRLQADRINLLGRRVLQAEKSVHQLREYSVSPLDRKFSEELHEHGYSTNIVTLPSGAQIRVEMYDTGPGLSEDETDFGHFTMPAPAPIEDLSICPACDKHNVYPVAWEEATPDTWEVWLRCPECEWRNDDVPKEERLFDQRTVDRFDDALDVTTSRLMRDLHGLEQANMTDEIDRFTKALKTDNILPEDF